MPLFPFAPSCSSSPPEIGWAAIAVPGASVAAQDAAPVSPHAGAIAIAIAEMRTFDRRIVRRDIGAFERLADGAQLACSRLTPPPRVGDRSARS